MYRSIMVPLDGSELAEWALPAAVQIARRDSAEIELLSVTQLAPAGIGVISDRGDGFETWRTTAGASLDYLTATAARISESSSVAVKPIAQFGLDDPAAQLVEHTHEKDTDLIIMATHGYGRFKRFCAGSVSDAVVRKSRIATLLIRPGEGKPDLEHGPEFRQILIPLDTSPEAETVIDHAIALGGVDADYTLITVLALLPAPAEELAMLPTFEDEQTRRAREDATQASLDAVAERLWVRNQRYRVSSVIRTSNSAARTIADYAATHAVDLITMTTHGRGGALRVMLGSVADAVARETTVPVLLFRPAGMNNGPTG
ncbi:MAG: universal stress protein [Gemmatimonadota bacterium]